MTFDDKKFYIMGENGDWYVVTRPRLPIGTMYKAHVIISEYEDKVYLIKNRGIHAFEEMDVGGDFTAPVDSGKISDQVMMEIKLKAVAVVDIPRFLAILEQ